MRSLNPLSVTLGFGAAPSSNVNGGSSSETITIPGFDFPLPLSPEARALSGLRFSGRLGLSYRLRRSGASATFLEMEADGRTYLLSPESRDAAPDAKGSDFSDASVTGTIVHRWQREGDSGPSALRVMRGQTWYDGERYTEIGQLAFDRSFAPSGADRLDLSAWGDWTRRRNVRTARVYDPVTRKPLLDPITGEPVTVDIVTHDEWWTLGLRGRWTHRLDWGDRANLSVTLRDSQGEVADATYTGVGLGAGYDWAEPVAGLRLGVAVDFDWREFDRSRYVATDREDLRATLRGTVGLTRFDLWGFEPTIGLEASRTESNVDRMDRNALTVDLRLRSTF